MSETPHTEPQQPRPAPPHDGQPQETEEQEHERKEREWEEQEVHEKASASARVVHSAILKEAEEELERPSAALAWSGLAAGLSMGFSLVLEGMLSARLPHATWTPLVTNFGYTIGFVILILGRQQLFTENTLTPVLQLLRKRDRATFVNTARMWGILLVTNLIGAVCIAYALQRTHVFTDGERAAFLKISMAALEPARFTLFTKSIFAGWLIALMVWMLPAAETGRITVLILIPYIVGLGHLSHIIIGSIYVFFTIAAHQHTFGQYFSQFFWPVLLGNCIGGVALVAALNHGQAMAGVEEEV